MKAKLIIWIMALLCIVNAVMSITASDISYMNNHIVGYWKLEENGITNQDASPNNHDSSTYGGGSYPNRVTGIINYGQNYNSGGSDCTVSNTLTQLDVTDSFSFSLWFNETSNINKFSFGNRDVDGNFNEQYYLYHLTGNIMEVGMCGTFPKVKLTPNILQHIVVIKNDSGAPNRVEIWLNGVWVNGSNLPDDCSGTEANVVYFGCRDSGGVPNSEFDGTLDEISIFNDTLNQTMIDFLYNAGSPGSDQQYSFSGGSPASNITNLSIQVKDHWNGSTITGFNVNITWSNGSSQSNRTETALLSLANFSFSNLTANITIWNVSGYYEHTELDIFVPANTSTTETVYIYQSYICFNASSKVSGAYITPDTITINGISRTCYNLSSGSYNVQATKTGWFTHNQTITISALSNTTKTIQNMSYANLTIYAIDGTTNQSLSNYNLHISSVNYTGWAGESATGVTNHSFYLINGTFNVTIAVPGYAVTTATENISVGGHTNYTFTLYKTNSVSITIRDEITNDLITDNVTVRWSDNTTTWENVTDTGTLFVHNITAGNYTLLFYSTNYSTRTYTITVGPSSTQFLTAYMISSTYSTIFTIKDIDTGSILDGVSITMYKLINSTWTTVESKVSDISGKAQFYYDPIANYRFYLSKTEYEDYIFYLNPILFSTYDVYMTKETVLNYSVDFDDISFIYSPTSFNNNANVTMNFLISSPSGMLTDYGIRVVYPGGNDSDAGVNAIGEQLSVDVNITNATAFDYVVLYFNYTTSLAGTRTYQFNLPINVNITAGTWLTNKDKTYGLGIFERMLIATIIILFIVGIATMIGQALPGVALGLFVYGFLVFIGFVPLWAILPSMLIGVLFLIWKSGGY